VLHCAVSVAVAQGGRLKKPSIASILFGLIPFAGTCFTVSLWDRIEPRIFGLPFNFFWLMSWLLLTPLCMWGAYRVETRRMDNPSQRSRHSS